MPTPGEPGARGPSTRGRANAHTREHTHRQRADAKAVDSSEEWTEIYVPRRAAGNGSNDVPRKSHRRGRSYDATVERARPSTRTLPPFSSQHTPESIASRSLSRRASRDLPPIPGEGVYINDSTGSSDSSHGQRAVAKSSLRTKRPPGPPQAFETRENLSRSHSHAGLLGHSKDAARPHLSARVQTADQVKRLPAIPTISTPERSRRPTQIPKPLTSVVPNADRPQPNPTTFYPTYAAPMSHGNHGFKIPGYPSKVSLGSTDSSEDGHNWMAQSTPAFLHSRSYSTSTGSSSDSKSSSILKSSGILKGERMQKLFNVLNTPTNVHALEAARRSSKPAASAKPQSVIPRSPSVFSFFAQPDESSAHPTSFRLRETTATLVNHYNAFRSSIVLSSGVACGELQAQAQEYQKIMRDYLAQFAILPNYVRGLPHVKRLGEQLEQIVAILEAVTAQEGGEQAIAYLDATMAISKALLKSAHDVLLNSKSVIKRSPSIDEDSDVEYEVANPAVANLVGKCDGPESSRTLRRMRSSMPAVYPTTGPGFGGTAIPLDYDQQTRRPLVFQDDHASTDVTQMLNLEAFSESLKVLRDVALSSQNKRTKHRKPEDTREVTYGQDGTPIAMSGAAIIKELIRQQSVAIVDSPGDGFIDIILTNFRFWWTPTQLLEHLRVQYRSAKIPFRKTVIIYLVGRWILSYWKSSDRVVIASIRQLINCVLNDCVISHQAILILLERLQRYQDEGGDAIERPNAFWEVEKMPFRIADVTRDMPLTRGDYENVRLLQFNDHESCEEFARQLTLKESVLYLNLSPAEVVRCFVDPGSAPEAEMKLRRQRDFSSQLKRWVAFSILKEKNPSKRARTFGFLARVANVCIRLRNFSSAHSIYNGLESMHIDSLPLTKAVGAALTNTLLRY